MNNPLAQLPAISILKKPGLLFHAALILFVADNVLNYFTDVPLFVTGTLILLPLMWLALAAEGKRQVFLVIFSAVFILTAIIGNLAYGFNKSNVSDLVFILFFATSFYYYKTYSQELNIRNVHIFAVVSVMLFSFSLAGINSQSIFKNDSHLKNLELVGISFDSLMAQDKPLDSIKNQIPENIDADSLVREKLRQYFPDHPEIDTMKNIGVAVVPGIKTEKESLDKLEKGRTYHYGLFRITHVPAYFFGFLLLFYLFMATRLRKRWYFVVVIMLALLIFYNGVRTFIVAAAVAVLLWFFLKRNIWYFVIFIGLVAGMIVFRYRIFEITQGTVFRPLSTLLITVIDNPDRLSRIALYRSWFAEIQTFHWYNFLVGKTFYQSKLANLENLFTPTWYHNDLLSVIFSYGLIAAIFYILFFIELFRNLATVIRKNALAFIFFATMILTALINGFYYYFPVFLLYLFWLMAVKTRKQETE